MANGTAQKFQPRWGSVITKTAFPFTSDVDGIAIAVCTPINSGSGGYAYIRENGSAHARIDCTTASQQLTLVFPVRKGATYDCQLISNIVFGNDIRIYPLA